MTFLCLIYGPENRWESLTEAERQGIYAEYGALTDDLTERGMMLGGEELKLVATARSVRVRGGESIVTAGPFAETEEQLGGYFLIEARDIDEAVEIAARIPSARDGTIEVRPVVEQAE